MSLSNRQHYQGQDQEKPHNGYDHTPFPMVRVDGDYPVAAMGALLGILVDGCVTGRASEHVFRGIAVVLNPFLVRSFVIVHQNRPTSMFKESFSEPRL